MRINLIGMGNQNLKHNEIPVDFDPKAYLELNPDLVAAEVDPVAHFLKFGHAEGRVYQYLAGTCSENDHLLHSNPQTQRPKLIDHSNIWVWLGDNFNKEGVRVLEIGSRAVSSNALWKSVLPKVDYVGFDVAPGLNVDVIGDAHFLSDYFQADSFDLVISFAVFEHLALPWIVAEEITKILKVGGVTLHETHFSFSEHELPWHFFQFNSRGLEILFSNELGFETLDLGMSSPIIGRFSKESAPYLQGKLVRDLYCHSAFAGKKIKNPELAENGSIDWKKVAIRIHETSSYPMESDFCTRIIDPKIERQL